MSISLSGSRLGALVLDIEGTTTAVDFVYQLLFPYARAHAAAFLEAESTSDACRQAVARLQDEQARDVACGDAPPHSVVAYVLWSMDRDRKSPGLKALQGLIWENGYETGELRGQVYADVPASLERWHAHGLRTYIYSSGSVLAQQLLFRTTPSGDLTRFLSGYFDTAVGPKTASESYRVILAGIGGPPGRALFISDVVAELDAAREAGVLTALCARPGWRGQPGGSGESAASHPVIHSFDDILD